MKADSGLDTVGLTETCTRAPGSTVGAGGLEFLSKVPENAIAKNGKN